MITLRFRLISVIVNILLLPGVSWAEDPNRPQEPANNEIPYLQIAASADLGDKANPSSEPAAEQLVTRVDARDIDNTLSLWRAETSKKLKVHFIDVPIQVQRQMTDWLKQRAVNIETATFSLPAKMAAKVSEAFRRRFPRVEGKDITLAMVRGPLVAGSSTAGLWVSGVPLPAAALIGATLGMGSGSIQLFMKYWEEFLNKSDAWGEKMSVHVRRAKFMTVEFALLAAQPAVFLALGLAPLSHFDAAFWGWFALNGLLTTATQGEWERQLMALKKRLIDKGLPHDIRGWDIMALGAMTGSLVWVGSAIIGIGGQMLSSPFLMGLGMSGYVILFGGSRVLQVLNRWDVTDYESFKRQLSEKFGQSKLSESGRQIFLNLTKGSLRPSQSRRCMQALPL